MKTKRAAIIHTIASVSAIVPAIGLLIGLIIGAADAGVTKHPRSEWMAIVIP